MVTTTDQYELNLQEFIREARLEMEEPTEEEIINRKMKVNEHIKDYFSSTSIHGVQYLLRKQLSEKMAWALVLVASLVGNSYLITRAWTDWNERPVIVTFAERASPVWEIPFPAITICPMAHYRAQDYPLSHLEHPPTPHNSTTRLPDWLEELSLLCQENIFLEGSNATASKNILDHFREASIRLEDFCISYKWKDNNYFNSPRDILSEIITSDGVCWTFNGLHKEDIYRPEVIVEGTGEGRRVEGWSLEEGYNEGMTSLYPERASDSGTKEGLSLIFMDKKGNFDYWCNGIINGFKVIIHSPACAPNVERKYFILEEGQQAMVGVEPNVIRTRENLRSYRPEMRQCYFPSERYLRFFKIYTQSNCELECITNFTLQECGCINFHMPRENLHVPVCGSGKKMCVQSITGKMRKLEKQLGLGATSCHCLPSCTTMTYKLDITQNKFGSSTSPAIKQNYSSLLDDANVQFSKLTVYFADRQFIASQRNELYGVIDFLANCGGLIGLFSGFSILSIVEIFYFLTIRCYNNVYS